MSRDDVPPDVRAVLERPWTMVPVEPVFPVFPRRSR